jgi:hemoglobin/transferrin/lactoferrin receptor protein
MKIMTFMAAAASGLPLAISAQAGRDSVATPLKTITVTATLKPTEVHHTPAPVAVIDRSLLTKRAPASIAELFRDLAGVDVLGIGGNQQRPAIRGQRGQRILLLEDGMRLGNSRRQQDFGELPSLVDVSAIERVEVVRGPSSVLYGTDAIGGVVNLITTAPRGRMASPQVSGHVGYRYGDAGNSNRGDGRLAWQSGGLSLQVGGSVREMTNYKAPAGTYGNVSLDRDTPVLDAGVKDRTMSGYVGWRSPGGLGAYVRAERYEADDAGFGLVEPSLLGSSGTRIQIRYPAQQVGRVRAGVSATALSLPVANRAELSVYRQNNGRDLRQNIFASFGTGAPPGAGIDIRTWNRTDVTTTGVRAELARAFDRHTVTYGVDYFIDDARGRDSSQTTMLGFGPPRLTTSLRSQVPNASLSSLGVFLQNDARLHERVSVVVGGRYQNTRAEPKGTSTLPSADDATGVFAINTLLRATQNLNLIATLGRGFRAPNLVERYFDGPTPEGSAYQSATPGLSPERSLNTDLGARWQSGRVNAEVFVFQNRITDGIRIAFAGDSVGRLPRYRNVNVASLRMRGAELGVAAELPLGFHTSGNWSRLLSKNVSDPALPVGDVYASKVNLTLGWREAGGRVWGEYAVRYNGRQKDIVAGSSPVGNELPAFTVHAVRGGGRLWALGGVRQDLSLSVNNLGNALYAEVANAGFFRPEARRNVVLSVVTAFE